MNAFLPAAMPMSIRKVTILYIIFKKSSVL
jgi:hypothetical protein